MCCALGLSGVGPFCPQICQQLREKPSGKVYAAAATGVNNREQNSKFRVGSGHRACSSLSQGQEQIRRLFRELHS